MLQELIGQLQHIDEVAFMMLNGSHCAYADSVMWLMTGRWAYVLMILAFAYLSFRKGLKFGLIVLVAIALTIALSDQLASSLIKPLVCRLRPSHTPYLNAYVLNDYRGGMYGFVSSHAANSFGVAMFVILLFRNRMVGVSMLLWAAVVSYSRIYLGVHYPGDIICGAVLGMAMAVIVAKMLGYYSRNNDFAIQYSLQDSKIMAFSILTNISVILIVAIFYSV